MLIFQISLPELEALHYKSTLGGAGLNLGLRLCLLLPCTRMVLLHILRITLVSALLFASVRGHCTNPKIRREWRRLSPDERAAWLNAVKVFLLLASMLSVLAEFCD